MEEQQVQGSRSKKVLRLALRNLVKGCWRPPTSDSECKEAVEVVEAVQCLVSRLPDALLVECLARIPCSSLPDSMMVCRKWRHILKSDYYFQVRRKLGRVEVLVFGGVGAGLSSATYCKSSRVWQPGYLVRHPALADPDLVDTQPVVVEHRIFILGVSFRRSVQDCTMVYDTWTKSLTRAAPMLCPRKDFACCVISNRIFVAGGASGSRDAIVDAEVYIPELNLWRRIASMPRKRYGCCGAAVDGIFYVIGGTEFGSGSMDSFDTRNNSWQEETKPLPMSGRVMACTVVGHCIYMLSSDAVEVSFWKYDTQTESWTEMQPPPVVRFDGPLKCTCVTMGSSVYVIQVSGCIEHLLPYSGGWQGRRETREAPVLVYDTHLQEWSMGPELAFVDNGAACTVVEC